MEHEIFHAEYRGATSLTLLVAGSTLFGYILDQIGKMRTQPSKMKQEKVV